MRSQILHEYFNTDLDTPWDTIQKDIQAPIAQIEAVVPPKDRGGARPAITAEMVMALAASKRQASKRKAPTRRKSRCRSGSPDGTRKG